MSQVYLMNDTDIIKQSEFPLKNNNIFINLKIDHNVIFLHYKIKINNKYLCYNNIIYQNYKYLL